MKKFFGIVPLAFMSLIVLAAEDPVPTQGPGEAAQPPAAEQPKAPKNEELSYGQRMVIGKVLGTKDIDVVAQGKTENHFMAKLSTPDNHEVIVDLGPHQALRQEIKKDDEVAAFGTTGRLNKHPLIVATKVAVVVAIEGREEIFEGIPTSYEPEREKGTSNNERMNSTERFTQEAIRQSNQNAAENKPMAAESAAVVHSECGCSR